MKIIVKIVITTILLFHTININAQRKYFAERYFNDFAYKKSAELFENIYQKGDSTPHVISRIGDSYYNNSEFKNAEKWYQKLLSTPNDTLSNEYYFKYAQTLKSIGKTDESDEWMLKFRDIQNLDSRPIALEDNGDYFSEYTNKESVFIDVHNISSNTPYSDFGGFIYNDKLFFSSAKPYTDKDKRLYKWNNQPFLNIYKANQSKTDNYIDVDEPEKVDQVNSKYHESNIIFTQDGNVVYFTRDNYDGKKLRKDKKKTVNLKIYRATKEDDKWSDVIELPFNSNEYSVGHPALSSDECTLYFVSDMPGGVGQTDIYKVDIEDNHQNYGEPINLGSNINTEGKEMFPFIGDNNSLYFSSNGQLGLGALDIFESKIDEDSYSKPVNLGAPINGPMDDFSFVINKETTIGYFSSNRDGGKGDDDIYSFFIHAKYRQETPNIPEPPVVPEAVQIPEEHKAPEICYEHIVGVVINKITNDVIPGAIVRLTKPNGELVEQTTSEADGSYKFENILCSIDSYTVQGNKPDYRPDQKNIQTKAIKDNKNKENLYLTPLIVGDQIVIKPIYFDFDKFYIRKDAGQELQNIVDVMRNHPEMIIKIESHTDSRGSRTYNRYLSDKRAKSTRKYIISRGIQAYRIQSAIGYGEDRLLNHCNDANSKKCSEEEHETNRRSYFYIVKGGTNVDVIEQQ